MRHEGNGLSLTVQFLEYHHDFVTRAGIEVAGRFVGENNYGIVHEGSCNGHALLLAARELVRQVVHAAFEPDHL